VQHALDLARLRRDGGAVVEEGVRGGVLADQRDEDGWQLARQLEQALSDRRRRELHAPLVRRVELDVVPKGRVQVQQVVGAVGARELLTQRAAKPLRLRPPRLGQLSSPLCDEERLLEAASLGGAHRLDLQLAVEPSEGATPQHELELAQLAERHAVRLGLARVLRAGRELGVALREQFLDEVEHLLQLNGRLELCLRAAAPHAVRLEAAQQLRVPNPHLELLLRRPVAVPHDGDECAQLGRPRRRRRPRAALLRRLGAAEEVGGEAVAGAAERRRRAHVGRAHVGSEEGRVFARDRAPRHATEDGGRVLVVSRGGLDEGPAVDVAHVRGAVRTEDVEPVDHLTEGERDAARHVLLVRREQDREADLLAARVAHHPPVQGRGLARLGVRILGSDRVDLQVSPLGRQELLVDVRAVAPDLGHVRVKGRRAVAHLAEEPLRAAPDRRRVVDVDVVVLGRGGLLHERLVDADAADLEVVLSQHETFAAAEVVVDDVLRHSDANLLQPRVDGSPIEELAHRPDRVEAEWLAEPDILADLREREALGVKGNEDVHHWPVRDGIL